MILYVVGLRIDYKDNHIKFILSAGIYSTDDLNSKIKVAVLKGRQDWGLPQLKDLKLVIPKQYTF